ncbi:stage V sporulation protein AB [Paraliobacillus quinghaiensis]|uniref:Stage V sporulation protein AB n=1 Tax=Paraliobacillus quinghaiensis TaxID=470815 RepID=A0A917TGB0_9BACI|nr:stage V sporulation protein AB [Paraliobacillus quinghaiensis]GGM22427.1 stage V sporulation protein AB [Paraliobacillus quinghaiensis]
MINNLIDSFIGFASGLFVGTGFVAFLTVLGIIPRLVQLTKTDSYLQVYEIAVIVGVLFGTYLSFSSYSFQLITIIVVVWGLFHGVFIGMLAAALTEVLNVFPILAKRIRVDHQIIWLMMAIVFGKILGSLFQWIILIPK